MRVSHIILITLIWPVANVPDFALELAEIFEADVPSVLGERDVELPPAARSVLVRLRVHVLFVPGLAGSLPLILCLLRQEG